MKNTTLKNVTKNNYTKIINFIDKKEIDNINDLPCELLSIVYKNCTPIFSANIDNELTKKYLDILSIFDYEVLTFGELVWLNDLQVNNQFKDGIIIGNTKKIDYAVYNALDYFGENWFEDHNLDIEKCFDNNIKSIAECELE